MRYVSQLFLGVLLFLSLQTAHASPNDVFRPLSVDWSQQPMKLKDKYFGHNTVWVRGGLGLWDEARSEVFPEVHRLVEDISPGVLRFPGGTRAMLYRFWEGIGDERNRKAQCDPFSSEFDDTSWGPMEFFNWAQKLGSKVSLVTPWAFSTPEEVASFVAFVNGEVEDDRYIAGEEDREDNNYRRWGKVSDWAKRRAVLGRESPFDLDYVEVSNEAFLDLKVRKKIDNPCWCDPRFPLQQCPQSFKANWQATMKEGFFETGVMDYVQRLRESSRLIRKINPRIKIGAAAKMKIFEPIQSNSGIVDAVAPVDRRLRNKVAWNRGIYDNAKDHFDFFSLHPYRILPFARLSLPQDLESVVKQFKQEFPEKGLAVTEFGFFKKGDTLANAIVSAEMIKIAVENDFEMLLRHILIEDQADSLFASHGAILGPDHKKTPAYHALKLMRDLLYQDSYKLESGAAELKLLATVSPAKDKVAILVINKKNKGRSLTFSFPTFSDGVVSYHYLAHDSKEAKADDITEVNRQVRTPKSRQGEVVLEVKAFELGVLILDRTGA